MRRDRRTMIKDQPSLSSLRGVRALVNLETGSPPLSATAKSLLRILLALAFGTYAVIALRPMGDAVRSGKATTVVLDALAVSLICLVMLATLITHYALNRLMPLIEAGSRSQARFLDTVNAKYVDLAIFVSAALSLFLELSI